VNLRRHRTLLAALALAGAAVASWAQVTIVSTQMRPVEEAELMRKQVLKALPGGATFLPEDGNTVLTRMRAELGAARGQVDVLIALDGELAPIHQEGGLQDLDELVARLSATREFSAPALALGRMGGRHQRFVPLMTNTFQMVAHRRALPYLPAGADLQALTYPQLLAWARAVHEATGERKLGFPAGPRGLWWRFFQASFYPSHTGGVVRSFRSPEAEAAWAQLRELWRHVNPRSTSYAFMEEPLRTGEVWIAFDHTARLLPALQARPEDFVAFPAPSGARGRGFMPVMVGLAIPRNAPDRAAAERAIDLLTQPATQARLLALFGFFPVVKTDLSALPAGVRVASAGMAATLNAPDGIASRLPVQLGRKNGEFNKIYVDTFTRIVLRGEDIRRVLNEESRWLNELLEDARVPCWAPDAPSGTQPCRVQ
jgi:multiple sugar transport system substrate-binding protein